MSQSIQFSRRPYKISYYKDGVQKTIRRVPPPKLHDILPQDVVELKTRKNDDWPGGDEYTVRHINPRHPNTIQLEDDDGNTTFVSHYDLELTEEVAARAGKRFQDVPRNNKYLLWP